MKKNAFTLIEILAVIVILAILLVIAVPKVITIIEEVKEGSLESTAKLIAAQAEKAKVQNEVLGINKEITCENVSKLSDEDYERCFVSFDENKALVDIKGSGKFEGMFVCKGTKDKAEVTERCPNEKVFVTISLNGGSFIENGEIITGDITKTYKEGTVLDISTPTKENSTFTGWNVVKGDSTFDENTNKLTVGENDTILHAGWQANPLITIDYDNGSENNEKRYITGTTIELEIPEKENYKFVKWEKLSGDASLSGNKLTIGFEDTAIKAIWELNVFNLSIDLDGGNSSENQEGMYKVGEIVELIQPTKTGYTFDKWEIVSGSDASVTLNTLVMGKEDTKVKAKYKANTYQINYELDGGILGENSPTSAEYGNTMELVNPSKVGYTFAGWTLSEGALLSGNSLTIGASDVVLTAKWTANTNTAYVVKHWIQNLGASTTQNSTNYTLNSTENKIGTTDSNVTPAVKTITGFKSPSTQTVKVLPGGSLVLNYYYTRNSYTFTLGSNAGVNTSGSTVSGSYEYGATITLKASANAGYTWSKWITSNTSLVGEKTSANTSFTMPAGNITMTPNVTANTYTISYNLNGGTNASNNPTSGQTGKTLTINNPTKANYTFKGWTVSGTGASMSGSTLTIGAGNITLTATWKENGATYITNLLNNENTLNNGLKQTTAVVNNKTVDAGIRYVGANPNNKVYFNCKDTDSAGVSYGGVNYDYASSCEIWRIIGVFDVENGNGKKEKRIKIIRDALFAQMAWDSSASNVNGGQGINQWGKTNSYEGSDLMRLLNGYYIGGDTKCRYCNDQGQEICENDCSSGVFYISPLSFTARNMIEDAIWNLGSITYNDNLTLSKVYNGERSSQSGKICTSGQYCNDKVQRTTTWVGKIGLIYPSDYGYASTDANCANDIMGNNSTCHNNNWLFSSSDWYWMLSPIVPNSTGEGFSHMVVLVDPYSFVNYCNGSAHRAARPSLYLSSNIQIIGGDGNTTPFKLAI